MRTPGEAFRAMCPCHGEIWILEEQGWKRVRKGPDDEKIVDINEPPLPVRDLLRLTNRCRAYFNTVSGEAELLVSLREQQDLQGRHTLVEILLETRRLAAMQEEQERLQGRRSASFIAQDGLSTMGDLGEYVRALLEKKLGVSLPHITSVRIEDPMAGSDEGDIKIPVTNPFGPNKPVSD